MSTDAKRRIFLRGSLAAGAVGVAAGAGLLRPQTVMAAWSEAASPRTAPWFRSPSPPT